ncbi:hypothetical protein [Marinifilum sp.]|uniref:hypothetical protein n=1 Tax=Marinifilum sp. TaxID=2033137 RepID=UPI003BAC0876
MRKITANYIFPVSSAPLKNGIIVLDDKNKIIDIIDTKNKFKEIENLEFYSGVIVPGFVDAFTLLSYSNFLGKDFTDCISGDFYSNLSAKISIIKADLQSVQRAINHLEAYGTKAALDLYPHPDCSPQKMKSKIYFSDSNRNLSLGLDEQEENSNSFTLINRYTLKENSILPKTSNHICIGTGSLGTHQKLSVFEEMKWIQARFSILLPGK